MFKNDDIFANFEKNINFIIDDGLLIKDNEVIAGESAKKASTKIETVKHALFYKDEEKEESHLWGFFKGGAE